MQISPLRTDQDLERALARVDALWGSTAGSPEGDELDVWLALVEHYEARHHAIPPGDPIEVIEFKLRELDWSQRELGRRLGWGSGRVSEVLGRKRGLTLAMVQQLAEALAIDPALLVGGERPAAGSERAVELDAATWLQVQRAAAQSGTVTAFWVAAVLRQAARSEGLCVVLEGAPGDLAARSCDARTAAAGLFVAQYVAAPGFAVRDRGALRYVGAGHDRLPSAMPVAAESAGWEVPVIASLGGAPVAHDNLECAVALGACA